MKIKSPYDKLPEPPVYVQNHIEICYKKRNKDCTWLEFDGKRDIQDELNQEKDTNSIYKIIDKFQNTNALFSKIEESIEFMKRIGKDPSAAFDGSVTDLTDAPKSLHEAAAMGAKAKEVLDAYINSQNVKSNNNNSAETTTKSAGQSKQETTKQATKEVGDK